MACHLTLALQYACISLKVEDDMSTITITKINDVWAKITSEDTSVMYELEDYFAFYAPNYKFHPKFKHRMWDGKIRLFSPHIGKLYVGLIPYLYSFCKMNKYTINQTDTNETLYHSNELITSDTLDSYVKSLTITNEYGKLISPYSEQLSALHSCVSSGRRTILSPTASGKSLIIYLICRWFLDHKLEDNDKILIIVPTTGLVRQLNHDFGDYSMNDNGFTATNQVHEIMAGKDKYSDANIYCSTWQSIAKMPANYFSQFKMVICDEVHLATAKSIKSIMEKCTNTLGRFGFTGTLDGIKSNKLTIEGLFGIVDQITTTAKLMAQGKISKLDISVLQLKYSNAECSTSKELDYPNEMKFISSHSARNIFTANLIHSRKGNSLTLVNHVKHGKLLYDMCSKLNVDGSKQIFFVSGSMKVDERDRIRKLLDTHDNIDIIATYGVFSTGMNAPNIHHVIFGSSSKGMIRVLQTIGRGLRKHKSKLITRLYDIVDDLQYKRYKNYALKHALERIKIYHAQEFKFNLKQFNLS